MSELRDLLDVPNTNLVPEVGRFLIATPYFNDTFFNRSVVLLTDVDDNGASGLIINKMLPYSVRRMTSDIRVDEPCFFGGPVYQEAVFLLHNFSGSKSSSEIAENVYVGSDPVLLSLIEHKAMPNLKYKFMSGYAGWSPGQLEEEILNEMWVVAEASYPLIFNTPHKQIWPNAVQRLGTSFAHWLRLPKILSYN